MLTGVTIIATCNLRPPSTGSAQCCKSYRCNLPLILDALYPKIYKLPFKEFTELVTYFLTDTKIFSLHILKGAHHSSRKYDN